MKEFDKWYENSGCAWSFPITSTNKNKFKVAWKAALEWALDAVWEEYKDTDLGTTWYCEVIRKELEDE